MSRIYYSLEDAALEIKRDIYKGPAVQVSRVQQQLRGDLSARERLNYSYSISPIVKGLDLCFPKDVESFIELGKRLNMKYYNSYPERIRSWLEKEYQMRYFASAYMGEPPNEVNHPALKTTIEGNVPSYSYQERLLGMREYVITGLKQSPDSRRIYWPIYQTIDINRSLSPTRVPCSIGYQFMLRNIADERTYLYLIYTMRSCDVDTFWFSDIFLAHQIQKSLAEELGVEVGPLYHNIGSFHSFVVGNEEVY